MKKKKMMKERRRVEKKPNRGCVGLNEEKLNTFYAS